MVAADTAVGAAAVGAVVAAAVAAVVADATSGKLPAPISYFVSGKKLSQNRPRSDQDGATSILSPVAKEAWVRTSRTGNLTLALYGCEGG